MTDTKCGNCNYQNPATSSYCQKCGTALSAETRICMQCGASNLPEAGFCGGCGVKLSEARFILAEESVSRWRGVLGSLEGMSPRFTPGPQTLAVWKRLSPPLRPGEEPFVFCVAIYFRHVGLMFRPVRAFQVHSVTMQGTKIAAVTPILSTKPSPGWLLATDRRLVAWQTKKSNASQTFYDAITSFDVRGSEYILGLQDGTETRIEATISRPGLASVLTIVGAPPEAKPHELRRQEAHVRRADHVERVVAEFFWEILETKRQRTGILF